jgi:(p)ppGpp synthase/HD superfamily hydrolase
MSVWDQDVYLKAWNFASIVHNKQKVPGSNLPYINHIGLVAMEAIAAIAHGAHIEKPNLLVVCALLHDTIEDTSTTYDEITSEFGAEIADGVWSLTKNETLPSKRERMEDSICRIKQQPQEVWMVKLCDRITNLQPPPRDWDQEKISAYKEEARFVWDQLGQANPFLAGRLKMRIDGYP